MNIRKKSFLIILLSFAVLLTACTFVGTTKEDMEKVSKEAMENPPANAGTYEDYSPERLEELLGSEKFLLFFHADWCPTCRILETKIKKDLGILNGHTVLKANYDREAALMRKYDVVVQSTVIFFNEDGTIAEKKVFPRVSQIEAFFQ